MKKLYILLILCVAIGKHTNATTFIVTNVNDAGAGSLRQSITDANTTLASIEVPHNIEFKIDALVKEINLLSGLPSIGNHININGSAATVTISGGTGYRIFTIENGRVVTISRLYLQKTKVNGNGGGIYNAGLLSLNKVVIDGTEASGAGFHGGGIYNASNATLSLIDSYVINNHASDTETTSGGGIYNSTGALLTITTSIVASNGSSSGGGILNEGNLTITNSTFENNWGGDFGGGLYNTGSALLTNVTIFNTNQAQNGGAVASSGQLTLINNTIAYNDIGGGIYIIGKPVVKLLNTIIVLNEGTTENAKYNVYATGDVSVEASYCILGTKEESVTLIGSNNIITADNNVLGSGSTRARFNEALTETISITLGSIAINAGTSTGAPVKDQSGQNRVGATDIGAYEYQSVITSSQSQLADNTVIVYSNPGHGLFDVELGNDIQGSFEWNVIDMNGCTLQTSGSQNKGSDLLMQNVNIAAQPQGMYLLVISTDKGALTKVLVKL